MRKKCVNCGKQRTLSYDTNQCHECESVERERELDVMDEMIMEHGSFEYER